jgi:hypothetical protein
MHAKTRKYKDCVQNFVQKGYINFSRVVMLGYFFSSIYLLFFVIQ